MCILIYALLFAYFMCNAFLTGRFYEEYKHKKHSERERFVFYYGLAICLLGGIVVLTVVKLTDWFLWIDKQTMIIFWIKYLFTHQHNAMQTDAIEMLNESVKGITGWKGKYYRYCVGLVNKRNNYKPEQ